MVSPHVNSIVGLLSVLIQLTDFINYMRLSIHNRVTRILVSILIFLIVLFLIAPHLMDVEPPLVVKILLKPTEIIGGLVGGFLSHPNIGTEENPLYEGTPIDLLVGLIIIFFNVLLYPIGTYLLLSLLSRILKQKTSVENNLNLN